MSLWTRISEYAQTVGNSFTQLFEGLSGAHTPPEKSVAFTIAMIALSAKMAKADGEVSAIEVVAFAQVFQVPEKDRLSVERVFNMAKRDIAGYETYAAQVAKLFGQKSSVLESVVDGLFHIAKADGIVQETELEFLKRVAEIFGFVGSEWCRIRSHHVQLNDDPYEVLGVTHDLEFSEIKSHYRNLVKELHPDYQIAAGVPEEMVRLANERMARVNAAFSEIEKARS